MPSNYENRTTGVGIGMKKKQPRRSWARSRGPSTQGRPSVHKPVQTVGMSGPIWSSLWQHGRPGPRKTYIETLEKVYVQ